MECAVKQKGLSMKQDVRKPLGKIWVLILALVLTLTSCAQNGGREAENAEANAPAQESQETDAAQWEEVVAVFGDHELTNAALSYYYWTGYASFLGYYGQAVQGMLDLYTPLDQQTYDGDTTWQDYFLENALTTFQQYCIICDLAQEAHYVLSENALTSLNSLESNLQENAEQTGFESVEAYLKANYGAGSSLDTYREFMRQYFTVMEYTGQLKEQFSFTDQEIADYYEEHAEYYLEQGVEKNDVPMANVRYLTVEQEEDSAGGSQAADQVFDAMLAEWEQSGDHSEEALMALGEAWSDRGAVQNYLGEVYLGGVALGGFDEWVFAPEREAGDYTVLDTEFGRILLYYINQLDAPYWYAQASYDLLYEEYSAFLREEMADVSYEIYPEKIVLGQVADLY